MAGVEDWPPYTGVGREGGGGGGRGKRPCFTGRDRVGPEYQSYTASRSSSKAVPVARHQTSYAELLSKEEENIRKEYKSGRGVTCEYSSASELIECDGQREKTKPLSDYPARDLSYQHREKNTWSHQKKSPSQFKPSRSMEEDGHRCMPGGGSEPAMDNSSCDKTGTSPGQMEEEERLARLRELKARLSSPTESIGSSASSGQFDDAEMERRSRSRTVSSSSDSTTTSSSTPLQELVIPLPDSTDVMRAKFISMETLRSSPIPLPDPSGCFSPRSDLSEEEAFSTERNHRETTPLAGAAGYTAITESSLPSQTAAATTEAHSFRTASYVRSEEAEQQEKSKPQLGPLMSESKPNYTPGSYLANRDKYLGLSSETSTTSSMSSSKMSCSSESSSKTSSESSSKTSSKTSSESKMSTESSKGSRDNTREKRYSSSATSRIQKELDEQYRALIGDDDFDNTSTSKETRREVPSSVKTERSLPTYDELLRESLQRQSRSRDNEPRDYYSKESLVKEVLAREARERDERERGKMKSKSSGYRSEQDFSQATSDRESMSSGYSSGSPGYTLKDYKSYVASKYGEDQAAKIRESVPKPYTVRYDSPSSPLEGDTPYFVRSDSVNSDRSYTSDRTYDSGMRGDDSYGAGYYQDGRFSVNRDRYGDLYTDRDYKKSKRAHSVASDRSYSSGAHRSSGYQSEGSDSDYFYGGVPPGQESKRSYHYTSSERPRQRQYQRSSSGDSMRSEWSSSERSRPEGFPRRQRQTVLDAISVLDGPVRNLVEDLLDPREWDKNSLWDRHGSLLKDDNFCRDFFTKDWAMDDDFYGDFFKKRTTTVKQTKTEIQPGKHGEPQRFHQTTTEKRVTDDLTGIPSSTRNQYQRGSSKYAKQSRPDERQYESPTTPPSRESPRDYGRGRQNQENMFDKTRFEFGSFGAYDGERRGSQTRNRGEDAEGASKAASDVQGCKIVEEPDEKEPETVPRQEESGSQAQPVGESNTLFFRDFDDLMHRFKDLKWKDALDAYMDERKGEEVVEVKDGRWNISIKN